MKGAVLAALVAFLAGLTIGGFLHSGAADRKAYADSLRIDRQHAALQDSLDARQRLVDSLTLHRNTLLVRRATNASQASGQAVVRYLPSIPDTVRTLDTAQTDSLRARLKADSVAMVGHLRDDSTLAQANALTLSQAEANASRAWAARDSIRAQLATVTAQLGAVIPEIGGMSTPAKVALAGLAFLAGHFVK